jgi:hypothetical protein
VEIPGGFALALTLWSNIAAGPISSEIHWAWPADRIDSRAGILERGDSTVNPVKGLHR